MGAVVLRQMIEQSRMNEAARSLGETLRSLGAEAISSSQQLTVSITSSGLSWVDEGGKAAQMQLPHGATFSAKTLDNVPVSSLLYSGRGFPVNGAVSFAVSLNTKSRTISLLATGMVIYP